MGRLRQDEIIQQMTDQEVTFHLVVTQCILLVLAVFGSVILFQEWLNQWLQLFSFNVRELLVFGVVPGLIVVIFDLILIKVIPEKHYDDGGINYKVFRNRSFSGIFSLVLLVAVSEEVLFRGVIQNSYGYLAASILFALVHFRYLKKIVLLVSVLFISFFIGYMFELTHNLLATIVAHFIIDFLLASWIRTRKGG
ncbi:CPBP family intramembrane glutamic endopeptidase [Thalassobacillus sp. CUG 92003]|uniref:CPBP family intramembrane glutamic endopeptidase n=1 Tax=Thalassobacillus sp. CUG 92003 TaxID=2736641 RepID=UPI0015E7B5EA|nr:type II CAAX endopeptidase family protein [Thalassobacillus sp. CUG 92003]